MFKEKDLPLGPCLLVPTLLLVHMDGRAAPRSVACTCPSHAFEALVCLSFTHSLLLRQPERGSHLFLLVYKKCGHAKFIIVEFPQLS